MKEDYKKIHKMCNMCERAKSSSCNFPCNNYADYMYNQSLKNNIYKDDRRESVSDDSLNHNHENKCNNDISDFLEYGVESLEWLMVLNNKVPYTTLFNESSIFDYLNSESEKYCDQEGICHECRTPLKEFIEYEDGIISERYWACGNGC